MTATLGLSARSASHNALATALRAASAEEVGPMDHFMARPEVRAFCAQAQEPGQSEVSLRFCATLLPTSHPCHAAWLALFCGALVEQGADPTVLFPTLQGLLHAWLERLRRHSAVGVEDDGDGKCTRTFVHSVRSAAVAEPAAEPQDHFCDVDSLVEALDIMVPPMMAMLMREPRNHQCFIEDASLMKLLDDVASSSSTLHVGNLHFLQLAAHSSYEDELVVVLPASRTGFAAQAHGIHNTFQAISLLQNLMRDHAQNLGIQRCIAFRDPDAKGDSSDFMWLQADAFADGMLLDSMRIASGEARLRDNMAKCGKRVLIALETDNDMNIKRHWSGFNFVIHGAQQPSMAFTRYLTPNEVALYLA